MNIKEIKNFRRELHQHPEVSGKEKKTAERIAGRLRELNPEQLKTGIGGYGVMALFSADQGQTNRQIAFRAELDGIPVHEENDLPYRSESDGVMHGCGHDGHMAIMMALAEKLQKNPLKNRDVWLLFQPAEETGEGAEQVLADPFFKELNLERVIALHNLPEISENKVVVRDGVFAAASTGIKITYTGRASHAAEPENGVSPAPHMADFITCLENEWASFKSRSPVNNIAVTYLHLGERAFGISPGTGELGITLRSGNSREMEKALTQIKKYIRKAGKQFDGEISIQKKEPFAVTENDEKGNSVVKRAAGELNMDIMELNTPFPWSEDFGSFKKACPITFFGLGAGREQPPLHSDTYDFNEELIEAGAQLFYKIAGLYDQRHDDS